MQCLRGLLKIALKGQQNTDGGVTPGNYQQVIKP